MDWIGLDCHTLIVMMIIVIASGTINERRGHETVVYTDEEVLYLSVLFVLDWPSCCTDSE